MKTVNQLRLGSPIVNASPDTPASLEYVQSRGTDLVTNGSGTLGTNYNFSGWTFTTVDAPTGAAGSFLCNTPNVAYSIFLDEFMPVDPAKKLMYAFKARQTGTSDVALMYGMLVPYDAYKNSISPYHYMFIAGTTTTLAADLNPGDPTVTLTSSANWYGSAGKPGGASTHFRSFIWWDYVDVGGKVWPPETYSRGGWAADTWLDGSLVGNVITLKVPYSGPVRPAGTVVSNGSSGGGYIYGGASATVIPKVWTAYNATISGLAPSGGAASFITGWPPGVGYCKAGFLVNYTTPANSRHAVASVSLSDASAAIPRANHTGTQLASTISDFAAAVVPVALAAQCTSLGAGVNLNTLTTPGKYYQGSNTNTSLALNYPIAQAGLLEVSSGYIFQRYTVYSGGSPANTVYIRGQYNSVWSSWTEQARASDPRFTDARTPTAHSHVPEEVTGIAVVDDDPRLDDSRYPTQHSHMSADINDFNTTADARVVSGITGKADVIHVHVPSEITGTAVVTADSRLSDARIPLAHNQSADTITTSATKDTFLLTERTKLTGIATAATANATDVSLRDRATHTGNMSADNVVDGATNHVFTNADNTKLIGIATGANVNLAVGTGAGTVAAGNDSRFGTGTPTGTAGGDLAGTYPNPTIKPLTIVDGDVAVANKDGLANVPSMRTLGTGAQQAAAGTHNQSADTITASATKDTFLLTERTKLTGIATGANVNLAVGTGAGTVAAGDDSRFGTATPTGTAGGDLAGTYPNPTIKPLTIVDGDVAVANKDGLAAVPSMRTLGTSAQQAVAGTDSRLADARNPLSHNHSTSEVTSGILPVARGGTNTDIVPILNGVVYGDGTKYKSTAASVIAKSVLRATTIGGVPLFGVIDLSYMPKAWPKEGVWQATTVNVVLSGEQSIDGEPGYAGFRYLVKNQTNPIENGIYIMEIGAWTRTLDTDTGSELLGAMVPVAGGLTQKGTRWTTTFDVNVGDTVGSSPMLWFEVAQRADQVEAAIATALAEVTIIDGGAP